MASTNKTTYYDLSQYTANDKPTYLVDYNTDMANIDAGIHEVDVKAGTSITNIGTMTDLQTTEKGTLVGAVNEVKSSTVANATNIAGNTTDIGTLANLNTTTKSNLVNAINEIVGKFNFNYKNNLTLTATNVSGTAPTVTSDINSAYNSDGSIGKIYGKFSLSGNGSANTLSLTNITIADTGLRPTSDITIMGIVLENVQRPRAGIQSTANYYQYSTNVATFTLKTDGTIEMLNLPCWDDESRTYLFVASLIFATDFGDTPVTPTT